MKKRLKLLWELQQVDNELDKLEELRGELPREVELLKEKQEELINKVEERKRLKKESLLKREENEEEIIKGEENLKKYKQQLLQIKTNREYDALMKETDHTKEKIQKLEEENNTLADLSKKYTAEIEEMEPEIEKIEQELKEKNKELQEIDKKTEKERFALTTKRDKIAAKVSKGDMSIYKRIRQAKKKAVVAIRRNACDGCFAAISSQKQLEIRRNDRIYTCESCGRILISSEIENDEFDLI
ncbi:MAG: C4-type zinc ribbon domain-containing protein [Ignavibacteria bacterium]|nr:C4-type zinc ribbon domain-containing protein [Ignavibacteria bacterium]